MKVTPEGHVLRSWSHKGSCQSQVHAWGHIQGQDHAQGQGLDPTRLDPNPTHTTPHRTKFSDFSNFPVLISDFAWFVTHLAWNYPLCTWDGLFRVLRKMTILRSMQDESPKWNCSLLDIYIFPNRITLNPKMLCSHLKAFFDILFCFHFSGITSWLQLQWDKTIENCDTSKNKWIYLHELDVHPG